MKSMQHIKHISVVVGVAVLLLLSLVLWREAFQADGELLSYQQIADNVGGLGASDLAVDDGFGRGLAVIGDLDNDGVEDIAVGVSGDDDGGTNTGSVYIMFMNADGTVDEYNKLSNGNGGFAAGTFAAASGFGLSIESIGDFNSDGAEDIAVGYFYSGAQTAVMLVYLDIYGDVIGTDSVTTADVGESGWTSYFGASIGNLGDLNNDGVTDLIVGVPAIGGGYTGGAIILFFDEDGTLDDVTPYQKISSSQGNFSMPYTNVTYFGTGVEGIGDFNGDGVEDAVISGDFCLTFGANTCHSGAGLKGAVAILYLNTNGTVSDYDRIDPTAFGSDVSDTQRMGGSVTALGDINGDDIGDLAIAVVYHDDCVGVSCRSNATLSNNGAILIVFMDADGTPDDTNPYEKISLTSGFNYVPSNHGFQMGQSLDAYDDLNGDGKVDLLVGSMRDDTGGRDQGTIFSFFLDGTYIPDDTTPPVPGSSGTLAETGDTETTLSFSWSEATDETSLQTALTYSVYYAASGTDLSTVNLAETNGTLVQTTADISSATISGLVGETTYALQVVVADELGNKAAYTQGSGTTGLIPDVTPPVPGSSGGMVKTSSSTTSLSIRIATASDNETEQGSIVYKLYRAAAGTDLSTVELAEANGTLVESLTGEVDFEATGLTANTVYTFNAIAEDASGNKVIYDQTDFTTDNPLTQKPTYPTRTSVLINGGAECTSSRDVTVTVQGTNVDRIVFANNQRFLGSVWEFFSGSPMQKTWTLLDQEGEQSIYVVFRSWHGNKSYIHKQTIAYEPTNPDCAAIAVTTDPEEETVTETPVTETPTTETPVTETPATETPTTETPSTETPVTETPVTETPVAETPVVEVPPTTTPIEEVPATPAENTVSREQVSRDFEGATLLRSLVSDQYALKARDGKNYAFADRTSVLSWIAYTDSLPPVVGLSRRDFTRLVLEPRVIGPVPGSLVVNFNNTYYWLEDGGSPTSVIARPITGAREELKTFFGRSWKKYVLNVNEKTAASYTLGQPIASLRDLGLDPETLQDTAEMNAIGLPQ